eukprot:SAG22_NODE_3745_length_1547_cov_1.695442_2_plen_68_part_01
MWFAASIAAVLISLTGASEEQRQYTQPVAVFLGKEFAAAALDEGGLSQKLTADILAKDAMKAFPGADG